MKNPPDPFLAVGAASVAGIALWISRAAFDVAGTTDAPIRVAMMPSPAELMGFIVMALLVAAGLAALLRTLRKGEQTFWGSASDALLPLFSLLLLVLPYLPWVADWIPSLRLLAGPGRFLIWVVVLGQVVLLLLPRLNPSTAAAIFGAASVAVSAPFVLNVAQLPTAFVDFFQTVRRLPSTNWSSVPVGSLGVLFDQEYGIFPSAPVLLLAVIGLAGMLRHRAHRRVAILLAGVILLLILLPATLNPWWSKSAMPGEQLLLLLPLLAWPIAWLYARLPPGSLSRAGAQVLLLFSAAITLAVVAGLVPMRQEADGSSVLLQWLSPTWQLWSEAPTFVVGDAGAAAARVAVWLVACGFLAWIFFRKQPMSPGRAGVAATTTITVLFLALASATAVTLSDTPQRFDVERRVVFNLLESFDPVARPIAIRYTPLSFVRAAELPPLFTASAAPGERTDPQPVRVVLNARFRLPAGKYILDLRRSNQAAPPASIGLQIGREGRPLELWPLAFGEREFDVPVDAEFVGFRASRQAEPAIGELRVTVRDVIEKRKRFPAGTVLSAASFPSARLFFHDSSAYPEAEGFWVRGRSAVRITMLKSREQDAGILLAVHSGGRPNVVTLSTADWSQKLELVPGVTERVTVPSREGERFISLTITTTDGFVPAEIDGSRDRRLLGAWVALIPGDIARTSATP